MILKRPADSRNLTETAWIVSRRTFSNNSYWDPRYMNYSDLEVINDDRVQPGNHTPEHLHENMNIYGYVVEGYCYHKDNLGNEYNVAAGSVQRMACGRGIRHTEGNITDKPNRYLQIWFKPSIQATQPRWDYAVIDPALKRNRFCDITELLPINTDCRFLAGVFTDSYTFTCANNRRYYCYIVTGSGTINNENYQEGDGFYIENEPNINCATQGSEVILFELR